MKVLHVIPYFVPAWAYGGPVKVVFEIAKRLVKKNYDITVFTTDVLDEKFRSKKKEETIEGIKVFRFSTISNSLSWRVNGFISPAMVFALLKRVKEFDLIHIHEYYTFQAVVTSFIARLYGIPYLISTHGSVLDNKERGRVLVKKIFNLFFARMIFLGAASIFVLNENEKKIVKKIGVQEKTIFILPNGINIEEYQELPPRGRVRKALEIPEKEKIILYVGRIYKTKGLDLLIRSLAYLKNNRIKKLRVLIVGPAVGAYKKELLNLAENLGVSSRISFVGPVYGKEKLNYFKDSDIYIQPSYSDGFPVSVLEALACGLPTVVTTGTNLFFLEERGIIMMVKSRPRDIALGIEALLSNRNLANQQIKLAKKFLVRHLTWDKILVKLISRYQKLTI